MKYIIESGSSNPTPVVNPVETMNPKDRMLRALKSLGIGWGLALACLPIPGLHFVLVPGFLLFGIGAFVKKLSETQKLSLKGSACPQCGKPLKASILYFRSDLPRLYCYECRHHLWLAEKPD